MPKATNDPKVVQMLREYRLALIAREDNQIQRLAKSWLQLEHSLSDQMHLLAFEIQQAQAENKAITEQLLREMNRYKQLQAQMQNEILKYARNEAAPDIEKEQLAYGNLAIQSASEGIRLTGALGVQFDRLPVDAVEAYVGYLGDGTPLYRLLKEAYPDALDAVIKTFLDGAARGLNPNTIAYNAARSLGVGLDRMVLIARTEQLRVSRNVSAEQYRTSGLDGYMRRVATKDDRVCAACLALDGEKIPLDQELDDHPRGRCVAVFQIEGAPLINWQLGKDWFEQQSPDLQKEILGDTKYNMWQDGVFQFEDLGQKVYDPTWGASPQVPSNAELENNANQN